jgi:hypothetical protein
MKRAIIRAAKWTAAIFAGFLGLALVIGLPMQAMQGDLTLPSGTYVIPVGLIAYIGWRIVRRVVR